MSVKQMVGEQTTNSNDATGSFDDIHKHQWGALIKKAPPIDVIFRLLPSVVGSKLPVQHRQSFRQRPDVR